MEIERCDARTLGDETSCDRLADAARRSGYEGNPARESLVVSHLEIPSLESGRR
jgi:hypothetical protein